MKIVKSLVTLIAVIAIGILAYFFVYKAEQDRKTREIEARRLIRFDLDQIVKFTLVRPDSSVYFERGLGKVWNITEPIQSEADKEPIYNLFLSLDSSDILYEVENKPKDLSVYKLDNPEYYMSMEYMSMDPDTLYIGASTPDETMTYVRLASENRVLAVNNHVTNLITRPAIFYRSRSMFNVLPDDIVGLEIDRRDNDEPIVHLVHNGIEWMISEPYTLPVDKRNLDEFLVGLSETRKNTLIAEKADDLSIYGLDNPQVIVTAHLKYGMKSKIVLIGNKLTERGRTHLYYAKVFDQDLIFTVEKSIISDLTRKLVWYMDKQPLRFNRNAVNKIEVVTTQSPITFMRDAGNTWSVVSPLDKNVEQETINGIYAVSRFIIAHDLYRYDPTEEDVKETGLDKPNVTMRFFSDDQLLAEIYFGKSYTTSSENTYFRTSVSPIIYITHSSVNAAINTMLEVVFGG